MASFKGSGKAKSLLEKMIEYPNVPRKKAKFFNFVRNSFRYLNVNDSQIDEIWSIIEAFDRKEAQPPSHPQTHSTKSEEVAQNGQASNGSSSPKKRKLEELQDDTTVTSNINDFDWLGEIKRLCMKSENNELPLEKLEKKVLYH